MAHQVALMYAGQIIEVARADEFFGSPRHPYARLLLQALPDAQRRGEELAAIRGTVPPLWLDPSRAAASEPRCDRAFGPRDRHGCSRHGVRLPPLRPRRAAPRAGALAVAATGLRKGPPARCCCSRWSGSPRFPIRRGLLQRTVLL